MNDENGLVESLSFRDNEVYHIKNGVERRIRDMSHMELLLLAGWFDERDQPEPQDVDWAGEGF